MAENILAYGMLLIAIAASIWSWWIGDGPCKEEKTKEPDKVAD